MTGNGRDKETMIPILLITFSIFAIAMLIMSVGVIFSGRCLRGSCGGPEVLDAAGQPISCAACPRRKKSDAERSEESLPVLQS